MRGLGATAHGGIRMPEKNDEDEIAILCVLPCIFPKTVRRVPTALEIDHYIPITGHA